MRHRVAGKKLNRSLGHRRSMFRNLVSALIHHGRIETTEAKARAVRGDAERLITLAKRGLSAQERDPARGVHARRLAAVRRARTPARHQVLPSFTHDGDLTGLRRAGPGEVLQERLPGLPVYLEFERPVVEPRLVVRVQDAPAAVLGRAEELGEERAFGRLLRDTLRLVRVLDHPQTAFLIDCQRRDVLVHQRRWRGGLSRQPDLPGVLRID